MTAWWITLLSAGVGGLIGVLGALLVVSRQGSQAWKQARYAERRIAYRELIKYVHQRLEEAEALLGQPDTVPLEGDTATFASMQAEVALSAGEVLTPVVDLWWHIYSEFQKCIKRRHDALVAAEEPRDDPAFWLGGLSRMTSAIEHFCRQDLELAPQSRLSLLVDRLMLPIRLWRIRRRYPIETTRSSK